MTPPFQQISIVLVRPQHSGNIGAIARSIANHGLGSLIIVDPPAFDPDIARWMAPHAQHIINQARIVPDIPTAIAEATYILGASARNRGWEMPQVDVPHLLQKSQSDHKIALLFGPEDSGLSNEDLQYCHAMISLSTHEHQSLNLSQAVNVFGAHLMEYRSQQSSDSSKKNIDHSEHAESKQSIKLSMGFQNKILDRALEVLHQTSFMSGKNEIHVRQKLTTLFLRGQFDAQEAVFIKSICDKTFHTIRTLSQSVNQKTSSKIPKTKADTNRNTNL